MHNMVLMPIPLTDLLSQFREIIKEEIKAEQQKVIGETLLSPVETCKIFNPKISRVTLDKWTKEGYLKRYDIGGRVYYRYSEVIEAAKTLKPYRKV